MSEDCVPRVELLEFYDRWKNTIGLDQQELKVRHFNTEGVVKDPNDPDVNRFAGKIAGQTELLLDFTIFLNPDTMPNKPTDIDKA